MAPPTTEDFPSAAAKHLDSASTLFREGHHDNAAYLAGYVVECSLKTLIRIEHGHPWGHDLHGLSRRAQELGALPGAATARYASRASVFDSIFDGWTEELRYQARGSIRSGQAAEWLEQAGRVYERIIVDLRLDGIVA